MDDAGLKSRMNHVLVGVTQDTAKELLKIDEEVRLNESPDDIQSYI